MRVCVGCTQRKILWKIMKKHLIKLPAKLLFLLPSPLPLLNLSFNSAPTLPLSLSHSFYFLLYHSHFKYLLIC